MSETQQHPVGHERRTITFIQENRCPADTMAWRAGIWCAVRGEKARDIRARDRALDSAEGVYGKYVVRRIDFPASHTKQRYNA